MAVLNINYIEILKEKIENIDNEYYNDERFECISCAEVFGFDWYDFISLLCFKFPVFVETLDFELNPCSMARSN